MLTLSSYESQFEQQKFVFARLNVDSPDTVKYFLSFLLLSLHTRIDLITYLTQASLDDIATIELPRLKEASHRSYDFVCSKMPLLREKERFAILRHWFICLDLARFLLASDEKRLNWILALRWAEDKGLHTNLRSLLATYKRAQIKINLQSLRRAVLKGCKDPLQKLGSLMLELPDHLQRLDRAFISTQAFDIEQVISELSDRLIHQRSEGKTSHAPNSWLATTDSSNSKRSSSSVRDSGIRTQNRADALGLPLDPTKVFTQKLKPCDTEQTMPEDKSPPPPPPGQLYNKADYDEEDIRILEEVGDYRFGAISSKLSNEGLFILPHEIVFDEEEFLVLLRASISLSKEEKTRLLQTIPNLSQSQIDELFRLFADEIRKYQSLSPKHLIQLKELEAKFSNDWQEIQKQFQDYRRQQLWAGKGDPTGPPATAETVPPVTSIEESEPLSSSDFEDVDVDEDEDDDDDDS